MTSLDWLRPNTYGRNIHFSSREQYRILRIIPETLAIARLTYIMRQNVRSLILSAHSSARSLSAHITSRLCYCSATPRFFSKLAHFYNFNYVDMHIHELENYHYDDIHIHELENYHYDDIHMHKTEKNFVDIKEYV